jgi:hypothetical protein
MFISTVPWHAPLKISVCMVPDSVPSGWGVYRTSARAGLHSIVVSGIMQSHWNSLAWVQDDPSQVNCTGCGTVGFLGAGPSMIVAVHFPPVQLELNV